MVVNFKKLAEQYRSALFTDVIPFWLNHSPDREHGGYLTSLDRAGKVYDTDKFMWLQGRQVWTFSMLYNRHEKNSAWLDMAALGVRFLKQHGRGEDGNWFFSLTRRGEPLVQPYNIFSDCFAAMGFSQYALAAGDEESKSIALQTFRNIVRRQVNPKGRYSKAGSAARATQSLVMPMIMSNLAFELRWMLPSDEFEAILDDSVHKVMSLCLDTSRNVLFETVAPDGTHLDTFDGRLISPGHGIEAAWFMMDIGQHRHDRALIDGAVTIALSTLEYGWDQEYGGILYFRDAAGKPLERLDWDQKLWWVHLETLQALLMGYRLTGRKECLDWFQKVHDWAWAHFADPSHGEWFGYLNRRGEVLLDCKGGKWKGCFHVPRALFRCLRELEQLEKE
jgi:N-acylglucosamine 2-epimerase